jgi:UDPglucose 6-dehydrogenase
MNIAVIGSGYVGLVASACFAEIGHSVICVDNDPAKLAALKRGEVPVHEEYLPELLARHSGSRLVFSGSLPDAVKSAQVVFIAVGTPPLENGDADMSYVEAVARQIAESLNGYKVVVEKSTVPIYTNRWVRRIIQLSGAANLDFDVVSNPEFLREGTGVSDFLYPDRIVIGVDCERAADALKEIYRPLTEGTYYCQPTAIPEPSEAAVPARLIITSTKSAELIKHVSNTFLAMKISFINAVANVCEGLDGDIEQVALGVSMDRRIGRQFLNAGIGYGGSCFPKDVAAFRAIARQSGYEFPMLDEIVRVNQGQRARFLQKVHTALWTLRGKRLAVLGLAFKGGTDDIRESPAIAIVRSLLLEQCSIVAYDPAAITNTRKVLGDEITYAKSACEAADGADALLILTDWEEFASLDLKQLKQLLRYPVVIDGRNLYSREAMQQEGLYYISVGRPSAEPEKTVTRAEWQQVDNRAVWNGRSLPLLNADRAD